MGGESVRQSGVMYTKPDKNEGTVQQWDTANTVGEENKLITKSFPPPNNPNQHGWKYRLVRIHVWLKISFPNESKWTTASSLFPLVFSLSLHVFPSYCTVYFLRGLGLQLWTAAAAPRTRNQPCRYRINEQEQRRSTSARIPQISPDLQDRFQCTDEFHILKHMRSDLNEGTVSDE